MGSTRKSFEITVDERGHSAIAKVGARTVGAAYAWIDSGGYWVIMNTEVRESHRRRGIATAMYRAIEQRSGQLLTPAVSLSDDAFSFWKSYRPEAVAGDLRHICDRLIGLRAKKGDHAGVITMASGRGATMTFDNHPQGPGTTTVLVGRSEINDALVAAGGVAAVPEGMAGPRTAMRGARAEMAKDFLDQQNPAPSGRP